jgi:hypothetical protein
MSPFTLKSRAQDAEELRSALSLFVPADILADPISRKTGVGF